jgi:hypothetical protein
MPTSCKNLSLPHYNLYKLRGFNCAPVRTTPYLHLQRCVFYTLIRLSACAAACKEARNRTSTNMQSYIRVNPINAPPPLHFSYFSLCLAVTVLAHRLAKRFFPALLCRAWIGYSCKWGALVRWIKATRHTNLITIVADKNNVWIAVHIFYSLTSAVIENKSPMLRVEISLFWIMMVIQLFSLL